jgi:hypothetical protein
MTSIWEDVQSVIDGTAPEGFPKPFNQNSGALANSLVVKVDNAYLYGFHVHSTKATAQYIMVFDAQTLPNENAVTPLTFAIGANADLDELWIPPRFFQAGIVICNSTTDTLKTIGSADCWFDVNYV